MSDPVEIEEPQSTPAKRLCNEIQLFDLCDLGSCRYKDGRFCTNNDLLVAFERISDVEERREASAGTEDVEDDEEGYSDEFDDGYESDYDDELDSDDRY